MDQAPSRYQVTCAIEGKAYKGTYSVADEIVAVTTGKGGRSKKIGSARPEILAGELLRLLVQEGNA